MTEITTENIRPFVRCVGIGRRIRQQSHYRAYDHRFIGILSGTGEVEIDGVSTSTVPGCAFIIPPGTPYRVCAENEQKIVVVNFDWTYADAGRAETVRSVKSELFREEEIIGAADYSALFFGTQYVFSESMSEHFDRLYGTYLADGRDEARKRMQLSAQFLYILTCGVHLPDAHSREKNAAELLYSYILSNYDQPLAVSDAAAYFHYSESYISKLLRRHYDMSFKQIVLDCRLKKARWLLENTVLSCEEIALQAGFYNGQHLSRAFRNKYGVTPGQLR